MLKVFLPLAISAFLLQSQAVAEKLTWNVDNAETNPVVGNPDAPKGGRLVFSTLSYPKSMNYMVSHDGASNQIWQMVVEPLCEVNWKSGRWVPLVAEKWSISEDKKEFTFYLNKKAKFSNGNPVTSKDIKAFWDIVQNPKVLAGPIRSSLSTIESLEIIDDHTVKAKAKNVSFRNQAILCGMFAMDHTYYLAEGKNFNKAFNNKIIGSGPYVIDKVKKGHRVTMKRRKDYWGADLPMNRGRYNVDELVFRTFKDLTIRFELFKKGEVDMFEFNVAKRWKTETSGGRFDKNWIVARRADTNPPRGFSGQIFNTRNELFKDVNVRKALAHSYNRERFIKELFYDNYVALNSYFPDSIYANKKNPVTDFNLKKSRALLKEAGWTKVNSKGILEKDGKTFSFTYLYTSKSAERYLTIWREDLKKIGIELKLEQTTWPTLVKKWDNYKVDMSGIAWSGLLEPDPFTNWHSSTINEPSGNNHPGFSTPELDKLITDIRPIFDPAERSKLFHKIDKILFDNHPYILGWHLNHLRIGYWNKFSFVDGFSPEYARGDRIYHYVWYDKAKDEALKKAMKEDKPLPKPEGIKGPNS